MNAADKISSALDDVQKMMSHEEKQGIRIAELEQALIDAKEQNSHAGLRAVYLKACDRLEKLKAELEQVRKERDEFAADNAAIVSAALPFTTIHALREFDDLENIDVELWIEKLEAALAAKGVDVLAAHDLKVGAKAIDDARESVVTFADAKNDDYIAGFSDADDQWSEKLIKIAQELRDQVKG